MVELRPQPRKPSAIASVPLDAHRIPFMVTPVWTAIYLCIARLSSGGSARGSHSLRRPAGLRDRPTNRHATPSTRLPAPPPIAAGLDRDLGDPAVCALRPAEQNGGAQIGIAYKRHSQSPSDREYTHPGATPVQSLSLIHRSFGVWQK